LYKKESTANISRYSHIYRLCNSVACWPKTQQESLSEAVRNNPSQRRDNFCWWIAARKRLSSSDMCAMCKKAQQCHTIQLNSSHLITNVLAGSVSPGLDAPRVARSFPNSPSEARWVRETSSHPRLSNEWYRVIRCRKSRQKHCCVRNNLNI
jgi:hypothetical protein